MASSLSPMDGKIFNFQDYLFRSKRSEMEPTAARSNRQGFESDESVERDWEKVILSQRETGKVQ